MCLLSLTAWLRGRVSWGKGGQEVDFATCVRFQKEGSRAGVPIGCKFSVTSRGSKIEVKNSFSLLPPFIALHIKVLISIIIIIVIIISIPLTFEDEESS